MIGRAARALAMVGVPLVFRFFEPFRGSVVPEYFLSESSQKPVKRSAGLSRRMNFEGDVHPIEE
jgi:hypothetical protein